SPVGTGVRVSSSDCKRVCAGPGRPGGGSPLLSAPRGGSSAAGRGVEPGMTRWFSITAEIIHSFPKGASRPCEVCAKPKTFPEGTPFRVCKNHKMLVVAPTRPYNPRRPNPATAAHKGGSSPMSDPQGRNKNGPGLSRRDFLRGTGVSAAATALAQAPAVAFAEAEVQGRAEKGDAVAVGPKAAKVTLNVNGADMTTEVEPRVTLLDALRNYLEPVVTSCKRVCDRGSCGACTVMVDGKPVYSCTMLALEARGKKIETAQSLVSGGKLDKVPAAFVQYDAQQCGFCTPGFVVAMHAALKKNPNATP